MIGGYLETENGKAGVCRRTVRQEYSTHTYWGSRSIDYSYKSTSSSVSWGAPNRGIPLYADNNNNHDGFGGGIARIAVKYSKSGTNTLVEAFGSRFA